MSLKSIKLYYLPFFGVVADSDEILGVHVSMLLDKDRRKVHWEGEDSDVPGTLTVVVDTGDKSALFLLVDALIFSFAMMTHNASL